MTEPHAMVDIIVGTYFSIITESSIIFIIEIETKTLDDIKFVDIFSAGIRSVYHFMQCKVRLLEKLMLFVLRTVNLLLINIYCCLVSKVVMNQHYMHR